MGDRPRKRLQGRDDVCDYLGIGKQLFYRLVTQGLPATNKTGRWMAYADDLDEWWRQFCAQSSPENGSQSLV